MGLVLVALMILNLQSLFSPYKRQPYLFTPAERNFYKALVRAVNGEFIIFGKVRVADLVTITAKYGSKGSMRSLGKIAQKHVDYCLCNPNDLSVVCVLELNDKSHDRRHRRSRDDFLDEMFKSVKLPVVWVTAKNTYDTVEIRQRIFASITQYEGKTPPTSHIYNPKEFRSSQG